MLPFKYKKEIANEYGWDRKTLYNKLRKYGIVMSRGLLSPLQQRKIYECLGYPSGVEEEEYQKLKDSESARN